MSAMWEYFTVSEKDQRYTLCCFVGYASTEPFSLSRQLYSRDGQRSSNSRSHVENRIMNVTIFSYYTAPLNAVERSVHLHGPSQLPVVNTFLIFHRC